MRTRVIPGHEAGYSRGFVAQYKGPDSGIWFDIGDPVATESQARCKAQQYEEEHQ